MKLPIPQIQRQQAPSVGGGVPQLNSVGMGGVMDAARSLEQAANLREQQAAANEERLARIDHENRKARNVERFGNARLEWAQTLSQREDEYDPQKGDFTPSVLGDFDKWQKQTLDAIPDQDERRMYEGMLGDMRLSIGERAIRFQATKASAYRRGVVADGIDTDARTVMADPSQWMPILAQRTAAIRSSSDLAADEKQTLQEKARESITYNAAVVLADKDPSGWLARDPAKDPLLSRMAPNHIQAITSHARAVVARQQSQAETEREKAAKDAANAVEDLQRFVLDGGAVSPEYESQVRTLASVNPELSGMVAQLVDVSRKGAGFATAPLERQKQALQAFTPGDPEQAKLKAHMQTVHDRQQSAYKEDPWTAATTFGRAPEVPSARITSGDQLPQLVAQRLALISRVETLAGDSVSPFKPDELPQVQQALAAMPVEKRGQVLGQIGAMLPVPRIAKLAEQLDKGDRPTALMLMAGADRTSAGAALATRIGQGAQAIKDKIVKRDDTVLTGWRSEISTAIRGSLGDAREEQNAIDAAYYVRAAMDVDGYEFKTGNQQAVEMVLGRMVERGGEKTYAPKGMTLDDFDAKLRSYDAARLSALSPSFWIRGKEVKAPWLAQRMTEMGLKRDSKGRYVPFYNGAAVTMDKDSQTPLMLEIR